jgi:hypothetical protein
MASSIASSSKTPASAIAAIQLVRSQIFQTSHNPQNLRTGAKYLKKRLRGPSMVEYVMPSYWAERERERIVAASAGTPLLTGKGKEKGGKVVLPEGGIQSSSLLPAAVAARNAGRPEPVFGQISNLLRNPDFHPAGRPSPYHPSTVPGASADSKINPDDLYNSIKDYRASSEARGDVPEGFQPVGFGPAGASLGQVSSNKGEGPASYGTFAWLADAHERTRKEEVRVKRIEGRGPPKKGEGRRSQMKRK